MTSGELKGVFVSHRGHFGEARGGTQICTREYFQTIAAAGITLETILIDVDQRLSTRLLKRINSSNYFRPTLKGQERELVARIAALKPDFVFINQTNLAHLAAPIRAVLPEGAKIVLLSHGMESTDLLHIARLRGQLPLSGRWRPSAEHVIGAATLYEAKTRPDLDLVFVLSASDAVLEGWAGARRTVMLPRVITGELLDWKPVGTRLGFVGTLDHAPNLEGFVQVLDSLARRPDRDHVRIRVIGGSTDIGEWLARSYDTIDYLGRMPGASLTEEAASWNGFLHPIFCVARGCSTKLAEPLGWGLPVVTTEQGRRGYLWGEGALIEAETPDDFVNEALGLLDPAKAQQARAEVLKVRASSPTEAELAGLIRAALDLPAR